MLIKTIADWVRYRGRKAAAFATVLAVLGMTLGCVDGTVEEQRIAARSREVRQEVEAARSKAQVEQTAGQAYEGGFFEGGSAELLVELDNKCRSVPNRSVRVRVKLTAEGRPTNLTFVGGSGDVACDDAIRTRFLKGTWSPCKKGQDNVACEVERDFQMPSLAHGLR